MKRELMKINIDRKELSEYIKNKISLEAEISKLTAESAGLKNEIHRMEGVRRRLLAINPKLSLLEQILTQRTVVVPCKYCLNPLQIPVDTQEDYDYMHKVGARLPAMCPFCGFPNSFDPNEIVYLVGWQLIPIHDDHVIEFDL